MLICCININSNLYSSWNLLKPGHWLIQPFGSIEKFKFDSDSWFYQLSSLSEGGQEAWARGWICLKLIPFWIFHYSRLHLKSSFGPFLTQHSNLDNMNSTDSIAPYLLDALNMFHQDNQIYSYLGTYSSFSWKISKY
jgi:hypothetical protein